MPSILRSLHGREFDPCNFRCQELDYRWVADSTVRGSGVIDLKTGTPPLALSFSKTRGAGHLLAVSNEDGSVQVFDTLQEQSSSTDYHGKSLHGKATAWVAHDNAIFDIKWTQNDCHMLTASGDQTIKLWNVETQTEVASHKWHTGSIKSISVHPLYSTAFVSSGRDGNIAFWDSRGNNLTCQPVAYITHAHGTRKNKKHAEAVTAALYLGDGHLLATAGAAGVIKFWDTRNLKKSLASTPEVTGTHYGYTSLSVCSSGNRIIGSGTNSQIHMFDVNSPEKGVTESFFGHFATTYYVKASFSPDGTHILSGSSDGNAYIWKVNNSSPSIILGGHSREVTAVDWCSTDVFKFATCSDDFTARTWVPKAVYTRKRPRLHEETSECSHSNTKMETNVSPVSVLLSISRSRTKQQRTLEKWFV